MPRANNNVAAHRRRKKYLKAARGNYGRRSNTYRIARQTVERGLIFSLLIENRKKESSVASGLLVLMLPVETTI